MDDIVGKNSGNNVQNVDNNNSDMNSDNQIGINQNGAAAIATYTRTLLIVGWICAAFTAFVSPFFAIVGVTVGVFINRKVAGSGNVIILTNIVLAAINILFGLFLIVFVRKAIFGY